MKQASSDVPKPLKADLDRFRNLLKKDGFKMSVRKNGLVISRGKESRTMSFEEFHNITSSAQASPSHLAQS